MMANDAKRPTLKTIADLTGLAVPTVSRALSNSSEISTSTKAKVQAVAAELGYVPNRAGVRLRTGRSYVIGLMLAADSNSMNFTARLIDGIATGLRGTRYNLTINPYFVDEDPVAPVRRVVETRAADALILNETTDEDPRVHYLKEQNFPFATHGRTRWSDKHDFYDFDNEAMAEMAVEALVKKGRKNLLLVSPPSDQSYAQDMIRGFVSRATALGASHQVFSGQSTDLQGDPLGDYIAERLASPTPLDGIICATLLNSLRAVGAVEKAGLTLGVEIDLFTKEAIPLLSVVRKEVLTIQEDPMVAGRFLAQAMLNRLENPDSTFLRRLERP